MSWVYIAGFFDGEGSLVFSEDRWRISIPQTNEDVLVGIRSFSGVGNLLKERKRQSHWKDNWVYYVASQKDAYLFLEKINPFLIVKKGLVVDALPKLGYVIKQQNQRLSKRKKRFDEAFLLRSRGLSYHAIELKMGLDRGYIRRLLISYPKKMEAMV